MYTDPKPIIQATPTFTTLDHPSIQFGLSPQSKWIDANDTSNKYLWHFIPQGKDTGGYATIANPKHVYADTGKYTVTLKITTTGNFCSGSDSAYAIVDIRPGFAIFIPNIFVPDSRLLKNMTFKPVISSFSNYSMSIFSRWGDGIYQTTDANAGWNGTILGQDAPSGVYVYKIDVTDLYGKTYKYTGTVTLWR